MGFMIRYQHRLSQQSLNLSVMTFSLHFLQQDNGQRLPFQYRRTGRMKVNLRRFEDLMNRKPFVLEILDGID